MFCPNCGKPMADGSMKCDSCGWTPIKGAADKLSEGAKKAEEELDSAVKEVEDTVHNAFNSSDAGTAGNADNTQSTANQGTVNKDGYVQYTKLKEDRSIIAYFLLSIITCGIYSFFFIYSLAKDINVACDGDGEVTAGLGKYILLSIITCGIYNVYWIYKVSDRIYKNGPRYGLNISESGTTMLLWMILGYFTGGIGNIIGLYFLIHNTNLICSAYNKTI